MYKLNIFYTNLSRANEQNAEWDKNLVNANLKI